MALGLIKRQENWDLLNDNSPCTWLVSYGSLWASFCMGLANGLLSYNLDAQLQWLLPVYVLMYLMMNKWCERWDHNKKKFLHVQSILNQILHICLTFVIIIILIHCAYVALFLRPFYLLDPHYISDNPNSKLGNYCHLYQFKYSFKKLNHLIFYVAAKSVQLKNPNFCYSYFKLAIR